MIIAVDFDGTCVQPGWPGVGEDAPGAVEWLREFVKADAKIILWTMRSPQIGTDPLYDAISWFTQRGIPLWGVNKNPKQRWSTSPKAYANIYIDDAAFGCPMIGKVVDWSVVGPAVLERIKADAVSSGGA